MQVVARRLSGWPGAVCTVALRPSPGKGRRRAWGEDKAGDTLTRNDMGVTWLLVGQTFFTKKVAWSNHGKWVEAAIRGFPYYISMT